MSRRADRLAEQAQIDAAWQADQQARPNKPPVQKQATDPDRCPINGVHESWTSKKDGLRRCYHCCQVTGQVRP